ncbi:MAG: hypothetical protein DYH20_01045 [Gammaproteobacteria bacterium PRO9]|nr:hypothetical protein [Gammaproteobacteria bacterium PRO9]
MEFWKTIKQPTLSDTADLAFVSNGVQCRAAGTVKFTSEAGDVDTYTVPAEAQLPHTIPVQVQRLWATGTTIAVANLRVGR